MLFVVIVMAGVVGGFGFDSDVVRPRASASVVRGPPARPLSLLNTRPMISLQETCR